MTSLKTKVDDFLSQERIAVAGVSRTVDDAANLIYRKLKDAGYTVYPVNPNTNEFDGDACYPDVKAINGGVDGVVIGTHPDVTPKIVQDCIDAGITRVWMHRSFVGSSVEDDAVQLAKDHHINVIDGGCPMMFVEPVDFGHKCMRFFTRIAGKMPQS